MNCFKLRESLNNKIIGKFPQSSKAKHNCDVWNEPKFIEHIYLEEILFEPIVSNAIISPGGKITDLISVISMGFTKKLLISGKLKNVFERHVKQGLQFFNAPIIYKGDVLQDYWVLNVFPPKTDKLDFEKSQIIARRKKEGGGTYVTKETISSYQELIETNNYFREYKVGQMLIRTMVFKEGVEEDFMAIDNTEGGVSYIVSENLKNVIEYAGCTGIEFQPSTISSDDWLGPDGGEREKIYGKA